MLLMSEILIHRRYAEAIRNTLFQHPVRDIPFQETASFLFLLSVKFS